MTVRRFEETDAPHYALLLLLVIVALIVGAGIGICGWFLTHGDLPPWL